jgi:hypothetical protein
MKEATTMKTKPALKKAKVKNPRPWDSSYWDVYDKEPNDWKDVNIRRSLAEEIRAQQATDLPPLAKEVEHAARDLEASRAVMQEKRAAYDAAVSAHGQRHVDLDAQLTSIENALRASASSLLQQYVTDCWNRIDEIRNTALQSLTVQTEDYNLETGTYRSITVNNADSVNAVLTALRQAAAGAENLKRSNLPEEELRTRLAALDATIPPLAGVALPSSPTSMDQEVAARRARVDLARSTATAIDRQTQRARAPRVLRLCRGALPPHVTNAAKAGAPRVTGVTGGCSCSILSRGG